MNNKLFLLLVIFFAGCTASHQHDGTYVANKIDTGIITIWILNGDKLTTYSMGSTAVADCDQSSDKIELEDGRQFDFNEDGDIILSKSSNENSDYLMVKISDKTDYTPRDLEKIIDETHDNLSGKVR